MQGIASRIGRFALIVGVILIPINCTSENIGKFGGGGAKIDPRKAKVGAAGRSTSTSPIDQAIDIRNATSMPSLEDVRKPEYFAKFAKISTVDYIQAKLRNASNEVFTIEGYQFVNVKDFLMAREAEMMAFAQDYLTVGDWFESMRIVSAADLTDDRYLRGVERAYEVLTETENTSPTTSEFDSNDLPVIDFALLENSNNTLSAIAMPSAKNSVEASVSSCEKGYHQCNAQWQGSHCCKDSQPGDPHFCDNHPEQCPVELP